MMTRLTWTLALWVCILLPLGAVAQSFEGFVVYNFSDPNEKAIGIIDMRFRGPQTAMKFYAEYQNAPAGVTLPPTKMEVLLNPEKKSIIMIGEQNGVLNAVEVPVPANATKSFNGTVQLTEESKTIAGYDCKKYLLIDAGMNFAYWVTEKIPVDASQLFTVMGNNNPFARLQAAGVKGMPLRIEQFIDGREPIIYEATDVLPQKLADESFSVPPGITVQSVLDAVKVTSEPQK